MSFQYTFQWYQMGTGVAEAIVLLAMVVASSYVLLQLWHRTAEVRPNELLADAPAPLCAATRTPTHDRCAAPVAPALHAKRRNCTGCARADRLDRVSVHLMLMTSLKGSATFISAPPKFVFQPTAGNSPLSSLETKGTVFVHAP